MGAELMQFRNLTAFFHFWIPLFPELQIYLVLLKRYQNWLMSAKRSQRPAKRHSLTTFLGTINLCVQCSVTLIAEQRRDLD